MKWLPQAVGAALLVLAPLGVVGATQRVADALGREWGSRAAWSLQSARSALGLCAEARPEPAAPEVVQVADAAPAPEVLAAPSKGGAGRGKGRRVVAAPSGGVRVSAAQVLALAQRGAMPRAVPVAASANHPAGLKLMSVSALGVGMQDGDVLTHVASVPAVSAAAVVDTVIRARARQAREISAEFWRKGARWALVVEQPYPKMASAAPAPSGSVRTAP